MTRRAKDFRLQIATRGASSVAGNVDFTFTSELVDIRSFGGQEIRPREVRTESLPWQIGVVDENDALTQHLSDAGGQADLQMRLARVQESVDGGAYSTAATGRVQNISAQDTRKAKFTVSMTDELALLRQQTIGDVISATTSLFPYGLLSEWREYSAIQGVPVRVTDVSTTTDGDTVVTVRVTGDGGEGDFRQFAPKSASGTWGLDSNIFRFMSGDLIGEDEGAKGGGFRHVVAHMDGRDHGVSIFNMQPAPKRIFLTWQGTAPSVGDEFDGFYIYAPGHPPTDSCPYHLGGTDGKHYMQLAKDLLTQATSRVDTASFDAIIARDGPVVTPRVTEDMGLIEWVQERLLAPNGIILYTKPDGNIAAKSIRLPSADDVNLSQLTSLDETVVRAEENVTFDHRGNEMITRVRGTWRGSYDVEPHLKRPDGGFLGTGIGGRDEAENVPAAFDMFTESENAETVDHENIADFGVREATFDLSVFRTFQQATLRLDQIAEETFARFAPGPVHTDLSGLSSVSTLTFGELVKVELPYYPNMETDARGGIRIMQVVRAEPRVSDTAFGLLDAGPDLQPLAAPSVSVAQNASVPEHRVDVTISGLPSGAKAVIQVAQSATEPADDSNLWVQPLVVDADGTYTIRQRAFGSTVWARARSVAPGRVSSTWAHSGSVTTASYSAPTGLTEQQDAGCFVTASWTNGTPDLPTEILLDGTNLDAVEDGAGRYTWRGLTTGTSYTLGVRHIGPYGGTTATETLAVTTAATADTPPHPGPTLVLEGESP